MSNKNMNIWEKVFETNPEHTKHVNQRGGFTAIGAQYQIKRATEIFGPMGFGWGVKNEVFTPMTNGMALYQAELWYLDSGKEGSFPINSSIAMQKNGRLDDDFAKKVTTDALTKGLSKLGFNSDIFEGKFDDNKYVQGMKVKFNKSSITEPQKVEIKEILKNPNLEMDESDLAIAKEWIKKPTTTKEQADTFIERLKSKIKPNTTPTMKLNHIVEDSGVSDDQA